MGRVAWGPRPKSLHVLPSSIEQMGPAFTHRRCEEPYGVIKINKPAHIESTSHTSYLEISIFSDLGRRVCVDPVAAACCCPNISNCWSVCMFSIQLYLLRLLLMKEGYLFPLSVMFILIFLVMVAYCPFGLNGQHCAYGFLPSRRTQSFNGITFGLTQMREAIVR